MADDLKERGPQDRSRINLNEDWEVKYWCGKWHVTEAQLTAAVHAAGIGVSAVAKHLGKSP